MSIATKCPDCATTLMVEEKYVGEMVRCPTCDSVFTVISPLKGRTTQLAKEGSQQAVQTMQGQTPSSSGEVEEKSSTNSGEVSKLPTNDQESGAPVSSTVLPESPSGTSWFLRIPEGKDFGPADRATLDSWVQDGRVASDCHLRTDDANADWVPAAEVYPMLIERGNPFGSQMTMKPSANLDAHRGSLIFWLSLAGCVIPGVSFWPAVLGTRDLHRMRRKKMDPAGEALTRAGQAIAMVSSMVWIGALAVGMLALLVGRMRVF